MFPFPGLLQGFGGGAGVVVPAPVISSSDNEDGTGFTVSISGSDPISENEIYLWAAPNWSKVGERIGDGTVLISEMGVNFVICISKIGSSFNWSNILQTFAGNDMSGSLVAKCYNVIWNHLQTETDFISNFKLRNRIHFSSNNAAERVKEGTARGDFPEVWLTPGNISAMNYCATTSTSRFDFLYSMVINTDDYNFSMNASNLIWACIVAFRDWQTKIVVPWKTQPNVVQSFNMSDVTIGTTNPERSVIPPGWVSVHNLNLRIEIPRSHLTYLE